MQWVFIKEERNNVEKRKIEQLACSYGGARTNCVSQRQQSWKGMETHGACLGH